MIDFTQFDENLTEVLNEVSNASSGEKKEVPYGDYEVKLTKLELTVSKSQKPMVAMWFKVLNGAYAGCLIFNYVLVDKGFNIHRVNEMLRTLGYPVEFKSYSDYAAALKDGYLALKDIEFAISYNQNEKGYTDIKILQVF